MKLPSRFTVGEVIDALTDKRDKMQEVISDCEDRIKKWETPKPKSSWFGLRVEPFKEDIDLLFSRVELRSLKKKLVSVEDRIRALEFFSRVELVQLNVEEINELFGGKDANT